MSIFHLNHFSSIQRIIPNISYIELDLEDNHDEIPINDVELDDNDDWHPRAKSKFFNEKKAEDFSQDDSWHGKATPKKQVRH